MDHLHLQLVRQSRPLLARARIAGVDAGVGREIQQRLLDEVRHQAGIRAVRQHRRRTVLVRLAQGERFLAQRVVGAPGRRDRRVGVTAGPRLDARIEIQRALLVRELDQRDARNVDRQVQQEIAAADQRIEHLAVVVARERVDDELDAVLRRLALARFVRRDDGDALGLDADVTQHERQHALADTAETDEDQAVRKLHVDGKIRHGEHSREEEKRGRSLRVEVKLILSNAAARALVAGCAWTRPIHAAIAGKLLSSGRNRARSSCASRRSRLRSSIWMPGNTIMSAAENAFAHSQADVANRGPIVWPPRAGAHRALDLLHAALDVLEQDRLDDCA